MKKAIALVLTAFLLLPLCVICAGAEGAGEKSATYNLIGPDFEWTKIDCEYNGTTGTIDYSYNEGSLTATATTLWPSMTYTYASPLPIKAGADTTFNLDVTVTSGTTNIAVVLTNGDVITLHHYLGDTADATMYDQSSGDLKTSGANSSMSLSNMKATVSALDMIDLQDPEEGYYYIKAVTVFAVYGSTTINKLSATTKVPEEAAGGTSNGGSNPETGDHAALFIVLGVIALTGSAIAIKSRK